MWAGWRLEFFYFFYFYFFTVAINAWRNVKNNPIVHDMG